MTNSVFVGRYELGRTLSMGNFCMIKLAREVDTGYTVAIKMLHKETVFCNQIMGVINRNLSIMKISIHPNVVRVYEVMNTEIKLFVVMEHVTGGKLFDKITNSRPLTELDARKYFQQLICAVAFCHGIGVYHGNLKPENLLLDDKGVLKVSDFGMRPLSQQVPLHTPCSTPHYMAPEVSSITCYEVAQADVWSCGVILFVLLAGYLPFNDEDIKTLYLKKWQADFTCPSFFSPSVTRLIKRTLDPIPATRITIDEILEDEWYKNEHQPARSFQENINVHQPARSFQENINEHQPARSFQENISSDEDSKTVVRERQDAWPSAFVTSNAIKQSLRFNLVRNLFKKAHAKRETSFISKCSANEIVSGIENSAASMGFNIKKRNYKFWIEGEQARCKSRLSISANISEADPPFHTVEIRKTEGDNLKFDKFCKDLYAGLQDITWNEVPVNTDTDDASISGAE